MNYRRDKNLSRENIRECERQNAIYIEIYYLGTRKTLYEKAHGSIVPLQAQKVSCNKLHLRSHGYCQNE
jgi:hypothetical protein